MSNVCHDAVAELKGEVAQGLSDYRYLSMSGREQHLSKLIKRVMARRS